MAPRPTEYKGTVFRSKSEAVFVRNLDLQLEGIWEYEPEAFACDRWRPDLHLMFPSHSAKGLTEFIIEYKPSLPTRTYFSELHSRLLKLGNKLEGVGVLLAWGSPFDTSSSRGACIWNNGKRGYPPWAWADIGIFDNIEEALTYRYDLQNP